MKIYSVATVRLFEASILHSELKVLARFKYAKESS